MTNASADCPIAYTTQAAAEQLGVTMQQIHAYLDNGALRRGQYRLDEYEQPGIVWHEGAQKLRLVTAESVERLRGQREETE